MIKEHTKERIRKAQEHFRSGSLWYHKEEEQIYRIVCVAWNLNMGINIVVSANGTELNEAIPERVFTNYFLKV